MRRCALFAALVLALGARAALGQSEFLPLLSASSKLTEKQAADVSGMWDQVGGVHLDGSVYGDKLKEAVEAAGSEAAADLDFLEVLRNATSPTSPKLSFRLWIPAVDPDTGLFAAFGVVQRAGREPGVFRILGMGAATEDGVLLVGNKDEDTGSYFMLFRNATSMDYLYLEGLEVWDANHTRVLDNHVIAQYRYVKASDQPDRETLELIEGHDPRKSNESQQIVGHDRETHGVQAGK